MAGATSKVLRGHTVHHIPSEDIVVGDVLILRQATPCRRMLVF
ncbi:MAG: hypothetical protein V8Q43_03345 [Christensenellaceae bacterium]